MLLASGRTLIAVLVVGALVVGCGGGGPVAMPRLDGKTVHAGQAAVWYVNFQWHHKVKLVPVDGRLDIALTHASDRWRVDSDGSDAVLGAGDFRTDVTFTRNGASQSFGINWMDAIYNTPTPELVDKLLASGPPEMGAWVLIVETLPAGVATAVIGSPRLIMERSTMYDDTLLAHELGHSSGLADRAYTDLDGRCTIMKSIPIGGEERNLADEKERDKMLALILP